MIYTGTAHQQMGAATVVDQASQQNSAPLDKGAARAASVALMKNVWRAHDPAYIGLHTAATAKAAKLAKTLVAAEDR